MVPLKVSLKIADISKITKAKCYKAVMGKGHSPWLFLYTNAGWVLVYVKSQQNCSQINNILIKAL